jgi:hypothetical protein
VVTLLEDPLKGTSLLKSDILQFFNKNCKNFETFKRRRKGWKTVWREKKSIFKHEIGQSLQKYLEFNVRCILPEKASAFINNFGEIKGY